MTDVCANCPDWIDLCWDCGSAGRARSFYADDTYCAHLQARYGHPVAVMADRYGDEFAD